MKTHPLTALAAGTVAFAAFMAFGITPAAYAQAATTSPDTSTSTSMTGSSTAPSYCTSATTTEGYYVFTDHSSYTPGQMINFCLLNNTRTPLFLAGTHPWTIVDQNGNTVFTPAAGTLATDTQGTSFFTDSWNGMNASSSNVSAGAYHVLFGGFAGSPFGAFTIMNASSTGTSTTSTGTTTPDVSALIGQLTILQGQYPVFAEWIQVLINALNGNTSGTGTTTGTTLGNGTIDQNGQTFASGSTIDFVGRNFSHETNITVTLNGQTVGTAHADGGGNFSTGNLLLPSSAGSYLYSFTGNGMSVPARITVR